MNKIALYGIKITYTPSTDGSCHEDVERTLVATFDTFEMAKAYVKKSRLKKPRRNTWMNDVHFRANSLLRDCGDYEIEIVENHNVPHNPQE